MGEGEQGKQQRAAGVLLHPTSLPGPGIGDLGPAAYHFIDWLEVAGQHYWQILPLVPVDGGGSPYNSVSAMAGNPLLISPELLEREGLLHAGEWRDHDLSFGKVDFESVARWKERLLGRAHARFREGGAPHLEEGFTEFQRQHDEWLEDFTLFSAIRDGQGRSSWTSWPAELRDREPDALRACSEGLAEEVSSHAFAQFLFQIQWNALYGYARERGIEVIGDVPIFVSLDSADVWANRDIFDLRPDGTPTVVAGVPPDYFSEYGQRWGNPLYRWDVLRELDYGWWVQRLRRTFELVDIVRLDHFRGFEAFWAIPAEHEVAVHGRWIPGPGLDFFRRLEERLGPLPIIAEDLGLITPAVEELRDELGFPGMRVLQFAFDGDPHNPHLPENYLATSVAYTGTHDNDTLVGWWSSMGPDERDRVRKWLGIDEPEPWDFISAVFDSSARIAIVPLQDVLELGTEARMNTPGSSAGNWSWRLGSDLPNGGLAEKLRNLTSQSGRLVS